MSWIYLFVAGLLEIGWPLGLKLAQAPNTRLVGVAIALAFMAGSGGMLWLAQKEIPMGTAYAVWTGIGAVGAFVVGLILYAEPATIGRFAGVGLILAGVVTLKLTH